MAALVGLVGLKQSGKDSFASRLVSMHGYRRLAFADALKAAAYRTNPLIGDRLRLAPFVDLVGWEAAKSSKPEVRRFLQEFGVAMRENVHPDVWVAIVRAEAAALLYARTPVVITDVRFPNEIEAIRELGGVIARIDRPGQADSDGHISEHAWRSVDPEFEIHNDGSLADLEDRADLLAEWVASR